MGPAPAAAAPLSLREHRPRRARRGVFAFVTSAGTDPEVILVIEARGPAAVGRRPGTTGGAVLRHEALGPSTRARRSTRPRSSPGTRHQQDASTVTARSATGRSPRSRARPPGPAAGGRPEPFPEPRRTHEPQCLSRRNRDIDGNRRRKVAGLLGPWPPGCPAQRRPRRTRSPAPAGADRLRPAGRRRTPEALRGSVEKLHKALVGALRVRRRRRSGSGSAADEPAGRRPRASRGAGGCRPARGSLGRRRELRKAAHGPRIRSG